MRHVLKNSDEVFHYWANKIQDSGRSGNTSFAGDRLYSYAAEIARHVTHKGRAAVLHTLRRWSVTTSGHQSGARSASSHLPALHVHELGSSDHRADFVRSIRHKTEKAALARRGASQGKAIRVLAEEVDRANRYCEFFGLPLFEMPTDFAAALEGFKAEDAKRDAARKRREAKKRKEALAAAERWKAGEEELGDIGLIRSYLPETDFMRIQTDADNPEDARIHTTKNVRVSVPLVKRAARFILPKVRNGEAWQTNGEVCMVGQFRLSSIEADGTVRIGCHTFGRSEVERVAALLGL